MDARYAAHSHGHTVGEISNAATLSSNSFTGNQTIAGNLTLNGLFAGTTATFQGTTGLNLISVNQAGLGNAISGRSDSGIGVAGTGIFGLQGISSSNNGTGVFGWVPASAGTTRAIYGQVSSPNGIAGVFENGAGGRLLSGTVGGVEKFRVDGTGAVYATSYRDLAGNSIASGSGDITGVAVGPGMTGGGISGDVSVALDTNYTDARYASLAHGHDVSHITNAATLGANTFNGSQFVSGDLNVAGALASPSGLFTTNASMPAIVATQNGNGQALSARTYSTFNNAALLGEAVSGTGDTDGVRGFTTSPNGNGVWGQVTAPAGGVGVRGIAAGAGGTGVLAVAHGPNGSTNVGLWAVSVSASGVAGVFDNQGGGALLQGNVNGITKFRVDGAGNVFASAFNLGGADFAESIAVSEVADPSDAGDVMIIDRDARRAVARSAVPYSTMVAGIHSTKPGVLASPYGIGDPRLAKEIPLAIVGIVPCKVTAENGAIAPGDLLVTSSSPGHAMKGTDPARMMGAIVGKALEPLEHGAGVIQVLVTLQ